MFNKKILFVYFCAPILALFPLELLRYFCAAGYGGYFDEPGLGWIIFYCFIIGSLFGAIGALLYLGIKSLLLHKSHYAVLAVLTIGLLVFATYSLLSDDIKHGDKRINHLIRLIAYQIFYAPIAHSITPEDKPIPTGFHSCIPPKTHIKIFDPDGDFEIATGKGLLRTYSWAGDSRSITMNPTGNHELNYPKLKKNRWQKWPYFDWKIHDGIAQCYSYENVLNFFSVQDAEKWIEKEKLQNSKFISTVYRNDGLVVTWSKNHINPDSLCIIVHQLLINGHKPTKLSGAVDQKIIQLTN